MKFVILASLILASSAQAYEDHWTTPGTSIENFVVVPPEYLARVKNDPAAKQHLESCIDLQVAEFLKLKYALLNPFGLGRDAQTLQLQKIYYRATPSGPPSMNVTGGEAHIRFKVDPKCYVNDKNSIVRLIKTKADELRKKRAVTELPESADESAEESVLGPLDDRHS